MYFNGQRLTDFHIVLETDIYKFIYGEVFIGIEVIRQNESWHSATQLFFFTQTGTNQIVPEIILKLEIHLNCFIGDAAIQFCRI